MNVVGHQCISVNGAAAIASRFFQPMELAVIVLFGEKARLAIDAARYDVQRHFSELDTWAARHSYWRIGSESKLWFVASGRERPATVKWGNTSHLKVS